MFKKIVVPGVLMAAAAGANAAVPADVTSALSSLQADATQIASIILVAIIAVFAIKFIRKGL